MPSYGAGSIKDVVLQPYWHKEYWFDSFVSLRKTVVNNHLIYKKKIILLWTEVWSSSVVVTASNSAFVSECYCVIKSNVQCNIEPEDIGGGGSNFEKNEKEWKSTILKFKILPLTVQ